MRARRFTAVLLTLLLAAVSLSAGRAVAAPGAGGLACVWGLDTWLPVPAGFPGAEVRAADGAGGFVGMATDSAAGTAHAVVWRDGVAVLLPTPQGWSSFALGANRRGDVVGYLFDSTGAPNRPVLWRRGRMIELAAPLGVDAQARDINDAGLIVGESFDQALAWSAYQPRRFRRVSAPARFVSVVAVTESGVLAGFGNSTVEPTNRTVAVAGTVSSGMHVLQDAEPGDFFTTVSAASGDYIAGTTATIAGNTFTARRWHDQTPQTLSTAESQTFGVNPYGDVTGVRRTDFHPVVWTADTEQELPLTSPDRTPTSGIGLVINDDGSTVGGIVTINGDFNSQPVLWHCH
jgi:uncharacterized membrane protein